MSKPDLEINNDLQQPFVVGPQKGLGRGMNFVLAFAVGVLVANLYYLQPILGLVAQSLAIAPSSAGLLLTLVQAGYGLSVLLVVPLGDILENKKLILSMMCLTLVGLILLSSSENVNVFFFSAFLVGVGSSCVQSIIPYVANLSPAVNRGQIVGMVMSGLMMGIMLSRPLASLITDLYSWHWVFGISALFTASLVVILKILLPARYPQKININYISLIKSMPGIFISSDVLRRRSIYQAALFSVFCVFWTAIPLYLSGPTYGWDHFEIAIFALVGVSSACVAPFAGRWADRGRVTPMTFVALLGAGIAFLIPLCAKPGSTLAVILLGAAAILLDACVSMNLVAGQRSIFALSGELRNRLNGMYIASIFVGGGLGSALGVWAYEQGGWIWASLLAALIACMSLLYFLTEPNVIHLFVIFRRKKN